MFKVIERYIGFHFLYFMFQSFFVIISLSSIIKFFEQIKKINGENYTIVDVLYFVLLNIPKDIVTLFPIFTLLGGILAISDLSNHNELIVFESIGFSKIKIIFSIIKVAIILTFFMIIISEFIVPDLEKILRSYKSEKIFKHSFFFNQENIWLKNENYFIFFKKIINQNEAKDISIYILDKKFKIKKIIHSIYGIYNYREVSWKLFNIDELQLHNYKKIVRLKHKYIFWKTILSPKKIKLLFLNPHSLSIKELYDCMRYFKFNKKKLFIYEINLWKKIFFPLSIITMLFMSISLILGPFRNILNSIRVLLSIFLGFIFYILNELVSSVNFLYNYFSIWLILLIPNLLFCMISFLILKKY
ncbi:MAG: LPS export ABC transporter permease LptG [Arsenophonus sp.]|nr:MAG: LPS export ABC transporter permease LptG [Arsenophonus sp.]